MTQGFEPYLFGAFASIDPIAPESSKASLNYKLAVEEFSTFGGIPIAGEHRLPVAVVCNGNVAADRLKRSLDFLVDDLEVSGLLATINDVTALVSSFDYVRKKGKDVFFLSPFGASNVVPSTGDDGLLWYLLPDSKDVAPAYLPVVSRVERYIKEHNAPGAAAPIRVALVVASDYAKLNQIGEVIASGLRFNGKSALENGDSYLVLNVPSQFTVPTADLSEHLTKLQAFKPHIVVSAAGPELLQKMLPGLEASWPSAEQPRPFYVLSPQQAIDKSFLLSLLASHAAYALHERVVGINIAAAEDSTLYDEYLGRLSSTFPNFKNLGGAENYYDALYFLLYAASAGARSPAPSAWDLAVGMRRLLGGESFRVGTTDMTAALDYLQTNPARSIALQGTLGPPDFWSTGVRKGTGSVWCIEQVVQPESGVVDYEFRLDVLRYDPSNATLKGVFPCLAGF